jgi:hypothetical protein
VFLFHPGLMHLVLAQALLRHSCEGVLDAREARLWSMLEETPS